MSPLSPIHVRFAEFELDARDVDVPKLSRNSVPVKVNPQSLRLLLAFVCQAGQTLTREDIAETVWGDRHYHGAEDGIYRLIAEVRRAVGDVAREPRHIFTVPSGYKFVGTVV